MQASNGSLRASDKPSWGMPVPHEKYGHHNLQITNKNNTIPMTPLATYLGDGETRNRNSVSGPPTKLRMDNEAIHGHISAMLKNEEHYICRDYLTGSKKTKGAVDVTCRAKVCQWIFNTAECAHLDHETALVAINYLDRYLSSSSSRAEKARCNRKVYQLAAMTSLYIADKISGDSIEMNASRLSQISRGLQSAEDIIAFEREMLASLRWKLQGPTPFQFISHILELLPESAGSTVWSKIDADSRRQVELAAGDYAFVPMRRSSIAVASILNSIQGVNGDDFPLDQRVNFVEAISDAFNFGVNSELIKAIRSRLIQTCSDSSRGSIPNQLCIPKQESLSS